MGGGCLRKDGGGEKGRVVSGARQPKHAGPARCHGPAVEVGADGRPWPRAQVAAAPPLRRGTLPFFVFYLFIYLFLLFCLCLFIYFYFDYRTEGTATRTLSTTCSSCTLSCAWVTPHTHHRTRTRVHHRTRTHARLAERLCVCSCLGFRQERGGQGDGCGDREGDREHALTAQGATQPSLGPPVPRYHYPTLQIYIIIIIFLKCSSIFCQYQYLLHICIL